MLCSLPALAMLSYGFPQGSRKDKPARQENSAGRIKPPNVMIFVSDKQRADTIPSSRKIPIRTAHLDWLAGRSTTFERAY